jgi:hypothetical protein
MANIDYETLYLIVVLELKFYESQIFVFSLQNMLVSVSFSHLGPIIGIEFQNLTCRVVRFKSGKKLKVRITLPQKPSKGLEL